MSCSSLECNTRRPCLFDVKSQTVHLCNFPLLCVLIVMFNHPNYLGSDQHNIHTRRPLFHSFYSLIRLSSYMTPATYIIDTTSTAPIRQPAMMINFLFLVNCIILSIHQFYRLIQLSTNNTTH